MSLKQKFDNLIDLKDHCLVCYGPTDEAKYEIARLNSDDSETSHCSGEGDGGGNVSEDEKNEKEDVPSSSSSSPNCCKSFLNSINRYLRIPYAIVNIAISGDTEPKTIRKRWDNLIKGNVCETCKKKVDHFRDLYHQYAYLQLQLDLVAQDIEQSIYLADQKSSSQAGKKLLERKWETEKEVVNPKLNFTLLSILRDHITAKAARKNLFPYVRLRRMPSPVRSDDQGPPEVNVNVVADEAHSRPSRAMASPRQRHRPSLNDDSGFSTTTSENGSPVSSLPCDEMDRGFSISVCGDKSTTTTNNEKECIVIRQVIRCKKCNEKIVKEKFEEHRQSNHPKPTVESGANENSTANPSATKDKEGTQNEDYRVKKSAIICPKDDCTGKFLRKESFLNHLGLYHHELLPKTSSDLTTPIPKVVSDNNDEETDTSPSSEIPSPVVTTPLTTTSITVEPTQNNASYKKQSMEHSAAKGTNSRKGKIRGPYMKRKFSCAVCFKKFHNEEDLLLHAQIHLMHQCNFCNTICKNPSDTALHEIHNHGDFKTSEHPIPFGCPRCELKFQNANTYKAHFWKSHLNKPSSSFKCFHCHATFGNVEVFKNHVSLKACNYGSSLKSSDDGHKTTATAEPQPGPSKRAKNDEFVCSICKLQCSSFFALKSHVVSHDPNIEPCSDCPRLFKDKAQLEKHRNNYHVPEPTAVAVAAPAVGIKIVIIRRFCTYCKSQKVFKSIKDYEKHISKHENKPLLRKKKRLSHFHNKKCPVCKQFFRNLGSHMRVHFTQPNQEEADEENRENKEPENNMNDNDLVTAEESEVPSNNEPSVEMEVDTELMSNADDEDDSSTRRSLADRVKLRQRRPSSHATVSSELEWENSEDEDDYTPTQRARKRSLRGTGRSGRNETKTDNENDDNFALPDYAAKGKKSKPMTVEETTLTAANEEPSNEKGTVENQNVDNAPNNEVDNTRQPLVNINSTLSPRSESIVDKTFNKDDQSELVIQSAVIVNSSLPPKKRPHPPASLPPSVSDELDDNDSSCSTVILTNGNRPKTTNSTNIQLSSSDPPANNETVQQNEMSPTEEVNSSPTDIKRESSDCVTSGNAKVKNWMENNDAASTSGKTQRNDDESADKAADKKPKVGQTLFTPHLAKRVSTFLCTLNLPGVKNPCANIVANNAKNIPLSSARPSTNNVTNPAENITSPPSPEVITID